MLSALERLAARHARMVVVCATIVAVAALVVGATVIGSLQPFSSEDPTSDSVAAREALQRSTGVDPYFDVAVLVSTEGAIDSSAGRKRVSQVVAQLSRDPTVVRVTSPFNGGTPEMVSRDRHQAFVVAGLKPGDVHRQLDAADRLRDRFRGDAGLKVGGVATFYAEGNEVAIADLARVELVAVPILFLLLFWVFRGVVAAAVPLLIGGLSMAMALFVLRIVSEFADVSIYALNIASALGLGLAIDYSLLMLARYREEAASRSPREALDATIRSAGRTVMFSAITVAASLASLLVFPQNFLYSIGIAGAVVAIVAAGGALVVLPSAVTLLGRRLDALAPAALQRAATRDSSVDESGAWYRMSRFVTRHPGMIAASAAVVLVSVGLPALRLAPTQVESRVVPVESSSRQVAEAVQRGFAPNLASPSYVVLPAGADPAGARTLVTSLRTVAGVSRVEPVTRLPSGGRSINVYLGVPNLSVVAQRAIREIRVRAGPYGASVGGEAAAFVDLKSGLKTRIPYAAAIVVLVTLLALFVMTGSVLIPVKAVIMNVLTIAATLGVMVLVFQDGRFEGLLGYTSTSGLEASQMIMLFAIAFGLSTDYGVFLLGRIKEARDGGAGDTDAIAIGLERTGRIITAAAALLVVAIGSLVAARHSAVKEIGFGVAVAVLIDATVVRALLVPSLMQLLGRWNWWAPKPLRRLHEKFGLGES